MNPGYGLFPGNIFKNYDQFLSAIIENSGMSLLALKQ